MSFPCLCGTEYGGKVNPKTHRVRRSLEPVDGVNTSTLPNTIHGYYQFVRSAMFKNIPIKSCLICRNSNFRVNRQPLTCKIGHTYLHDNVITDIASKCEEFKR